MLAFIADVQFRPINSTLTPSKDATGNNRSATLPPFFGQNETLLDRVPRCRHVQFRPVISTLTPSKDATGNNRSATLPPVFGQNETLLDRVPRCRHVQLGAINMYYNVSIYSRCPVSTNNSNNSTLTPSKDATGNNRSATLPPFFGQNETLLDRVPRCRHVQFRPVISTLTPSKDATGNNRSATLPPVFGQNETLLDRVPRCRHVQLGAINMYYNVSIYSRCPVSTNNSNNSTLTPSKDATGNNRSATLPPFFGQNETLLDRVPRCRHVQLGAINIYYNVSIYSRCPVSTNKLNFDTVQGRDGKQQVSDIATGFWTKRNFT
jgi:hypothetical protein